MKLFICLLPLTIIYGIIKVEINRRGDYMDKRKEDIKRALDVSKKIRQNAQKEVLPADIYIKACDNVKSELDDVVTFLKKAIKEPELFFTDAKEEWRSHRSIMYEAIRHNYNTTKIGSVHEFQVFIADQLNKYFQEWAKVNKISEKVVIECRTPNSFPSIFAVYVDDYETIQFNIFDKKYGARSASRGEEDILISGQRRERTLREDIKRDQEQLDMFKSVKEKPFSTSFSLKWYVAYIFRNKRTVGRLDSRIESLEKRIKQTNEEVEEHRKRLPYDLEENKMKQYHVTVVAPFFEKLKYELETRSEKLY